MSSFSGPPSPEGRRGRVSGGFRWSPTSVLPTRRIGISDSLPLLSPDRLRLGSFLETLKKPKLRDPPKGVVGPSLLSSTFSREDILDLTPPLPIQGRTRSLPLSGCWGCTLPRRRSGRTSRPCYLTFTLQLCLCLFRPLWVVPYTPCFVPGLTWNPLSDSSNRTYDCDVLTSLPVTTRDSYFPHGLQDGRTFQGTEVGYFSLRRTGTPTPGPKSVNPKLHCYCKSILNPREGRHSGDLRRGLEGLCPPNRSF